MRPSYRPVVGYSSGQRGQTVNLLGKPYTGSNPVPTTIFSQRSYWVVFLCPSQKKSPTGLEPVRFDGAQRRRPTNGSREVI